MITKVKLKNWRSHLDSELDFSEGTNCFVGSMGTGKTSIMDAICFGLFGTFLQLQQKKMKLEDIIMKKPTQKDQAEVTVYFDVDGNEWSVKRTVTKGRSTAELRRNGELIEGPQALKVTEEVEKILKMDYDLFSRAVYSEQNQLDMFLTIPKGQRMKKIDELLAIDRFEKARMNTKSLINKCSIVLNEKERLTQNLDADEGLKKFEVIRHEMLELKEKEEKMKKQLDDVVNKKLKTVRDLMSLKEQQKKMQVIEEDTKKYTALLEITEVDIEKLKGDLVEFAEKTSEELKIELERIAEDTKQLNYHIEEEKANMDKLKEEYAEDNANIKLIEEEKLPNTRRNSEEFDDIAIKLKKSPLKKIESEFKDSAKDFEKTQLKLQKSVAKASEVEDSLHDLSLAGSVCPVCSGKLTENKKSTLMSKRKKQIEDLKKEIEYSSLEVERLQDIVSKQEKKFKETEKTQERFEELKDCKKELKLLEDQLKDLKSKTKVFNNQKKMFEKNIGMLEGNLKNLQERESAVKQILSKKEDVNEKLDRMKEYRQKLSQLSVEREMLSSFSLSILEKFETDYQIIIGLEKELQTHLSNLSEITGEKQKLLDEVENKKKLLENYRIEMRKIEAISEQLQFLENALVATQEQLRKDFVYDVNQAMQSIWPELYPYKDIYNIRLGIEEGDYILQLQDSTGWIPADGVASGGERSIACLALRIAFSLVLAPQLQMLVLDEPTANLDTQAIDVLASILRERISQLVEQCFLITHDEKLKEAVSGFCYEFNRDKSKDETTKVSLLSSPLNF
jgi:exonuclease SbcC